MKKIIKKILLNKKITQSEVSDFIISYIKIEKNKDINATELTVILSLVMQGIFDIKYAAKQYANKLGMQIIDVLDTNKQIIQTNITC
jgi:predicted transcriptional regulator YheO